MLGGAFLCFEAAEKVMEKLGLAWRVVKDVRGRPAL